MFLQLERYYRWRFEEGRQKGLQEARQEARQEGLQKVLAAVQAVYPDIDVDIDRVRAALEEKVGSTAGSEQ